jgi:hypothetical protein
MHEVSIAPKVQIRPWGRPISTFVTKRSIVMTNARRAASGGQFSAASRGKSGPFPGKFDPFVLIPAVFLP